MSDKMTPQDLKKAQDVFTQAQIEHVQKCGQVVEEVLAEFNCTIVPQFIFRGMQTIPGWLVVPISKNAPPSKRVSNNGK